MSYRKRPILGFAKKNSNVSFAGRGVNGNPSGEQATPKIPPARIRLAPDWGNVQTPELKSYLTAESGRLLFEQPVIAIEKALAIGGRPAQSARPNPQGKIRTAKSARASPHGQVRTGTHHGPVVTGPVLIDAREGPSIDYPDRRSGTSTS
ncbi:hypothetical protein OAF34_06980 [Pirellulaceae bacterium]|nr:hypothetical protein [Pirellulaceae bacterium]